MLGNNFIYLFIYLFIVHHQALLYLVNKPIVLGQISKWFLLLQEFDFKVIYKLGRVHFLLDHLSKISHGEPSKE